MLNGWSIYEHLDNLSGGVKLEIYLKIARLFIWLCMVGFWLYLFSEVFARNYGIGMAHNVPTIYCAVFF